MHLDRADQCGALAVDPNVRTEQTRSRTAPIDRIAASSVSSTTVPALPLSSTTSPIVASTRGSCTSANTAGTRPLLAFSFGPPLRRRSLRLLPPLPLLRASSPAREAAPGAGRTRVPSSSPRNMEGAAALARATTWVRARVRAT